MASSARNGWGVLIPQELVQRRVPVACHVRVGLIGGAACKKKALAVYTHLCSLPVQLYIRKLKESCEEVSLHPRSAPTQSCLSFSRICVAPCLDAKFAKQNDVRLSRDPLTMIKRKEPFSSIKAKFIRPNCFREKLASLGLWADGYEFGATEKTETDTHHCTVVSVLGPLHPRGKRRPHLTVPQLLPAVLKSCRCSSFFRHPAESQS